MMNFNADADREKRKLRVLMTGFRPFNNEKINPSFEAVKRVAPSEKIELIRMELPVSYEKAPEILRESVRKYRPDAVICVGQAGGRSQITPEKCAINWMEAAIPDEDGVKADGRKISMNGPDGLFSTLPVHQIAADLRKAGIPSAVSFTAGTYVCNALMYSLLNFLNHEPASAKVRAGFIHVPYLTEQVIGKSGNLPSLELSQIVRGLECAINSLSCEDHRGNHADPLMDDSEGTV